MFIDHAFLFLRSVRSDISLGTHMALLLERKVTSLAPYKHLAPPEQSRSVKYVHTLLSVGVVCSSPFFPNNPEQQTIG